MAKRKYLKLRDPKEVRKSMNRVANMLLNGEIDPKTANALIYAGNAVLAALRADKYDVKVKELENRIEELISYGTFEDDFDL